MPTDPLSFVGLKSKQRDIRDGFETNVALRIHRSLSWLQRAEQEPTDPDARFIFLWVSLNAAYAEDTEDHNALAESSKLRAYFTKIEKLDNKRRVYDAIWSEFSNAIRNLLNNRYIYAPFWKHHNGVPGFEDWQERFDREQSQIKQALQKQDTVGILSRLFSRLYVLRNQLMHGGATWSSSVNRDQVRDGARILGFLIPVFLDLMMDHHEESWGQPHYPVIEQVQISVRD